MLYLFIITGSNMPCRTPGRLLQARPTLLSFIGCCCLVTPFKLVPRWTSLNTCIPSISASGYGCMVVIIILWPLEPCSGERREHRPPPRIDHRSVPVTVACIIIGIHRPITVGPMGPLSP
uniref:Uncharacterized protein n=1 Tax=Picea glauca TaxID=3330 RepID=A0A101LXC0_PICGL|nr:hypothetical protein ABT39_MTgene6076 [Picea glauca]